MRKRPRKISNKKYSRKRYRQQTSSFAKNKSSQLRKLKKKRFKGNIHVKRTLFLKKLFWGSIVAAALAATIFSIFFSTFFELQKWEVIEKEITFYNHYLDPFISPYKGDNLIFINTDSIQTEIQKAHPNLSYINVKKVFPHTLSVEIEQFPLSANIINLVGPENIEQKIIINSNGIAIEKDSVSANLPTIIIKTEKSFSLLDEVIAPEKLNYITTAVEDFEKAFGMKITQAEHKEVERELHLKTEKGFTLWLDNQKSSSSQFLKLKKGLSRVDIYSTPIEYIDLRVSGVENDKIFVKRK